jgi:hypothetical protein
MFGSNFNQVFGIPTFPQNVDAQGGYLGPNAVPDPMSSQPSQNAAPPIGQPATSPTAPTAGPAATPALGQSSPLAGGPLAPGGAQPQQPTPDAAQAPPAAGIGSPFGKPQV